MSSGFLDAALSAFLFGLMPLLTKVLYGFGVDPSSASFYRMLLMLPLCALLIKRNKNKLILPKKQSLLLAISGLLLSGMNITLYTSYLYMDSGPATVVHFMYPVIVFILSLLIYKEPASKIEYLAIIASTLGMILMYDPAFAISLKGFLLAFLSAIFFAFYCLSLGLSTAKELSTMQQTFYINLFGAVTGLIYASLFGKGIFRPDNMGEISFLFFYSFYLTLLCTYLLQRAIGKIGPRKASMLSTLEPVVSILVGLLFLSENITFLQGLAVMLIIGSGLLLTLSKN